MRATETSAPVQWATDQRLVGLGLALATAIISGIAIYVNSYAVKEFSDPTLFATLKNTLVGLALVALLVRPATVREMKGLTARQTAGLGLLGLIGGSIPFVLFFEGLSMVTSGNAAFIHKSLFVWVAVLAVVFLKERVGLGQAAALGLLMVATVLLGGPGALELGTGAAMVLIATLLWSLEVIVAKRLLGGVSAGLGASARMSLGALLLLGYMAAQGGLSAFAQLTPTQWAWGMGTAALLFCYVVTWYGALKRAPATAVTCVLTLGAPITALLGSLAGRPAPAIDQVMAYGVLLAGVAAYLVLGMRRAQPATAAASATSGGVG